MSYYKIIDRFALVLAVTASAAVLTMHEPVAAIAMLSIWPITRATASVLDVFYTFFTNRPLITALTSPGQHHTPVTDGQTGLSGGRRSGH
ncbi:hypothetical protein DEA8626_03280 [Defluviimonas aquaemixtae]|uniref:Uncharacterized protein n=1 Tax=Albidovulum aquaemixtae TaxID=1542388 RepID=A0A2R8BLF8_9RHOB|nr:hypothetical protein [Defluviimonas aquaemixtae]SPH24229.1 hypothetical protein DEA8626_03280 [Defluviimonas aquaemixtae]